MPSSGTTVRGAGPLADAVRASQPDLATEPTAVIVRVALALLVGYATHSVVQELARQVKGQGRTGPLPDMTDITSKADAAAKPSAA
jgi:hypothetical protein